MSKEKGGVVGIGNGYTISNCISHGCEENEIVEKIIDIMNRNFTAKGAQEIYNNRKELGLYTLSDIEIDVDKIWERIEGNNKISKTDIVKFKVKK